MCACARECACVCVCETMCMLMHDFLLLTWRSLESHSVVTDPCGEKQKENTEEKREVKEGSELCFCKERRGQVCLTCFGCI